MNLMKKTFFYLKNFIKKEKKLSIFLIIIFIFIILAININNKYLIEIPQMGGTIAEIKIAPPPRFINPVLANSDTDRDLLPLIYSSLIQRDNLGNIIPSIASVSLSEDKKVYTVELKKNIYFSDGKNLSADDVIFTIKKIQDPFIRSPHDVQWLGVKTKKIDEHTLTLTLSKEYAQFKNNLASLYILPKHLWFDILPTEFPFSNLNWKPIGSGPYIVRDVITNNDGKIVKYNLRKNNNYWGGKVFIENILFYFFDNYDDYKKSLIFSNRKIVKNIFSVSSQIIPNISTKKSFLNYNIVELNSSRNFALFINEKNNPLLSDLSLRKAISLAIDTDGIIKNSLNNYAKNISTNINTSWEDRVIDAKILKNKSSVSKEKTPVQINLAILNSEEFKNIAQNIKKNLSDIGIEIVITSHSESDLIKEVIRDRNFEILLFGYQTDIVNPDLYYFFHSSQKSDPGINIASFSNKIADKLIMDLRKNISDIERAEKLEKLREIITSDYLYIPLYSPSFIYVMDYRLKNFHKKSLNYREERFQDIMNWYIKTKKIFPFLNN